MCTNHWAVNLLLLQKYDIYVFQWKKLAHCDVGISFRGTVDVSLIRTGFIDRYMSMLCSQIPKAASFFFRHILYKCPVVSVYQ